MGTASRQAQFIPHNDGVRTQHNTFQKYFVQDEFRTYVERTLDANAILVAPGICLVFRDPKDEQLFLVARQQVKREWRLLRREPSTNAIAELVERNRPHIDAYWTAVLKHGRPVAADECPEALPLTKLLGSWRRIHDWAARVFHPDEMEAASIGRQEDLLVYFALGHFGRRKPYAELPLSLQRDVRFFFGSITTAKAAGKRALYPPVAEKIARRVGSARHSCGFRSHLACSSGSPYVNLNHRPKSLEIEQQSTAPRRTETM